MSVYLVVGGDLDTQIATNQGLGDFTRWVDSLSVRRYPLLSHLVDWGWVNDLNKLELEIESALASGNPDPDVEDIAQLLLRTLEDRPVGTETVMLTNGLSRVDDVGDDQWWIDGELVETE